MAGCIWIIARSAASASGPELNLHLDRWGEAAFKYYYVHDQDPNAEHQQPAAVREHSRKSPAVLFRLSGHPVHQPERQGAGELPERSAGAA